MESCIADNEKDLNDNNAEREKLELQKQDARVVTNSNHSFARILLGMALVVNREY